MIGNLIGVISQLLRAVATSLATCALLVIALFLMALRFLLETAQRILEILRQYAPALRSVLCVSLFVAGLVAGTLGVGWFYANLTDLFGGAIVAAAFAWLLVANVILQRDHIWAAMVLSGLTGLPLFWLLPGLEMNEDFVFVMRGVPVSLALAVLVYFMFKYKSQRS